MTRALPIVSACIACIACIGGCGGAGPLEGNALLRDSLLNAVQSKCTPLARVTTPYATDVGAAPSVTPCALADGKAIAWQSDLDVDCDGGQQDACRSDPEYQGGTSATTAGGAPIDANAVPFVVVPLSRPDGMDDDGEGVALGNAAYVIFDDKIVAGVFADEGPSDVIGEASFAMAEALGIDPDPVRGGADGGATFIVFTGADAAVQPIEDHDEAERVAKARAEEVVVP